MNTRVKIICDDKIPFLKGVLEPFADVKYLAPADINAESVKEADALLIRTRTKCNEQLLNGSNVKFIGTATIGYDHIDTEYCKSQKIKWINAPGCNSSSVMQYMASALITLAKMKSLQLSDMTIGIVGVGNVGSKIARLAGILGMKALLNDPPRQRAEGSKDFVDLDTLISMSDIITFHVPLIREGIDRTYHFADEKFFERFNRKKIIINTSRGEVIKTAAIKNAINSGSVKACLLDVWEDEPRLDLELMEMVDIATPHIAGYSTEGKANGTSVCVRAITEFFGFGIDKSWYPAGLPAPVANKEIKIDCSSKHYGEILSEAILHTYNILNDDSTLQKSVDTFEKQRGSYPVRREFPYFSISSSNCGNTLSEKLSGLGFNLNRL